MNGVMTPYLNQPSPTAREILGICFKKLNIQRRKLWKISYWCGWYCFFSIHLVCSFLVCLVHVLVCSIVMHFIFLLLIEVISIGLLCSVLVCLGYGLFIGIGEFILCGKTSNIEQFLVFVCLLIC